MRIGMGKFGFTLTERGMILCILLLATAFNFLMLTQLIRRSGEVGWPWTKQEAATPKEKHETVCANLEKQDINGTLDIYPAVFSIKNMIEQDWMFRLPFINGSSSKPRMWDGNGVMCEMQAELCDITHLYCMDIRMIVPVNYTEYDEWIYNGGK